MVQPKKERPTTIEGLLGHCSRYAGPNSGHERKGPTLESGEVNVLAREPEEKPRAKVD